MNGGKPKPVNRRITVKMDNGRNEHLEDLSLPPADPHRIVPEETLRAMLSEIAGRKERF